MATQLQDIRQAGDRPAYLDTRIPVPVPSLGLVKAWKGGEEIPPLFIEAEAGAFADVAAVVAWATANRSVLDALILAHGGIMLRGFPLADAADFQAVTAVFPPYKPGYVAGMSPRRKVKGDVLESTRLPENFKLGLHSEMSYMKAYPPRIAFFCRQAALTGGETTIGSMRRFMQLLPPDLKARLNSHDVHIVRSFGPAGTTPDAIDHADKVGWDEAFFTSDRTEVEQRCAELGIEPIWNEDGSLTLLEINPPFTVHPRTGECFYRNNLHRQGRFDPYAQQPGFQKLAAEMNVQRQKYGRPTGQYLDTGELLDEESQAIIGAIFEGIELFWPWQNGDVMILDNLLVVHGRNRFTGPREVLVALLDQ